jgi:hypothetical protein
MRFRLLVAGVSAFTLMSISSSAGAVTRSQLESKALSISNFPTGWSVSHSSPGNRTGGCLSGVGHSLGRGDVNVEVAFHDGRARGLGEGLTEGAHAKADYAQANRIVALCKNLSLKLDGTTVTGTIGSMPFPMHGNQTNAYAATVHIDGVTIGIDYVFLRVGSVVAIIAFENNPGQPNPPLLHAYVVEAVNKIEGKSTVAEPGE